MLSYVFPGSRRTADALSFAGSILAGGITSNFDLPETQSSAQGTFLEGSCAMPPALHFGGGESSVNDTPQSQQMRWLCGTQLLARVPTAAVGPLRGYFHGSAASVAFENRSGIFDPERTVSLSSYRLQS